MTAPKQRQWRCFHCDALFTSAKTAAVHFGASEVSKAACQLKDYEEHLVVYIRELEARLDGYIAEDSHVMRAIYMMEADHRQALIRAEEQGYNKGVQDARKEIALCQQRATTAAS